MGGGNLDNKGFAISGILYPVLILTLFLIVQILFMMQSRKTVLDRNKKELIDTINTENKVYTNEELSILVNSQRNDISNLRKDVDNTKLKILDKVEPLTITVPGKYYITNMNEAPFGTVGYVEVEVSNSPNYRRVIYKHRDYDCTFENIMSNNVWSGWKLIAGEVVLWEGNIIPNDTPLTLNYPVAYFSTLRFSVGTTPYEYMIDAPVYRYANWWNGATGWTRPSDDIEVVEISGYVTGDKQISVRSAERIKLSSGSPIFAHFNLYKIIGRP